MQGDARAQTDGAQVDDPFAIQATSAVVLAHVLTGNAQVDEVAEAGLQGLSDRLTERTSIEPEAPIGVDIERDELAFFPFLYWPLTADQPLPSAAAYTRLNAYLRTGGMILFDTRDGDVAGLGGATPEAQALQRIASGLDIPPLEPIPSDHVLTRSFYLLQDFPGRHTQGTLWVEAAPPDAALAEGMPFRNLNDGVTPVVIGGNDWASAWAVDDSGAWMLPVGRGFAGETAKGNRLPLWHQHRDACADGQLQIGSGACAGPAGKAGAMIHSVVFDPLVPVWLIWGLAVVAVGLLALAVWRGLPGWALRAAAAGVVLTALANPALQEEDRAPLTDIVLLVVDESASQGLSDRAAQTEAAVAAVQAEVAALPNTELRISRLTDGAEDAGTLAMTALAEALAEEPRARVAGAILITDGQVHDLGLAPSLPAPLHVLLTGRAADWDRRLVVKNAPAFAILGEEFMLGSADRR